MTTTTAAPTGLWGGRFTAPPDPLFKRFNDSLPFDYRLVEHDIAGSIAWARALGEAGVLALDEVTQLVSALETLNAEALENLAAVRDSGHEDVHSWVEAKLIEKLGPLGKKLHTGRSRNDQVATDLRLFVKHEIAHRIAELRAVQQALVRLAERHNGVVIPGYTHLQPAQPVLFAHWCLAYYEMLARDVSRFKDAAKRADVCPLGSGALAGTTVMVDRENLAISLGFASFSANSLDAVSDRDFVLESIAAAATAALHLSKLAEDLIIYNSAEFGFIELSDAFTSGSSLMPQKKNPDALELIRGKTGRIAGAFTTLAMTLKGLPLAYNKDLQEDKEPLFDAFDQLSMCLRVLPPMLGGLKVRAERTRAAAGQGHSNATELADHLVGQGVPFRDAHEMAGRAVIEAVRRGVNLEDLSLDQLAAFAPGVQPGVHVQLTVDSVVARRSVAGGTAPDAVRAALRTAKQMLIEHAPRKLDGECVLRQARIDDLDAICRLVDYWAQHGENLPRSRETILEAIADFGVAEVQGEIVGCGSLSIYTPQLAEIRSLGTDPDCQGVGAGSKLVHYFLEHAAMLHIPKVFVLTRAPEFFARLGFKQVPIDSLPQKIQKDCQGCPKRDRCDEIAMVHDVPLPIDFEQVEVRSL